MQKGFTLVEMLVVIGIIAVLTGASIAGFSKMRATAERAKAQEMVSNTATALSAILQEKGFWPKRLLEEAASGDGRLEATAAFALRNHLSLNNDGSVLIGLDRLGVFDSWGAATIKARGSSASLSSPVGTGGTLEDHILHFAIDLDDDGFTEASVGGESLKIRATAAVWCAGKDGKLSGYKAGLKSDDIYSWSRGQVAND